MPQNKRKKTRNTTKRTHTNKKRKTQKQPIHLLNLILTILLITTTISMISYFMFFNDWDNKEAIQKTAEEKIIEKMSIYDDLPEDMDKYFEEKTEEFDKIYLTQKPEDIAQPKVQGKDEKAKEQSQDPLAMLKGSKPMLAIIIDDVSWKSQVKLLQSVGYPINMSFLPPTPRHKNSANAAQVLDQYMIHLPLQATSFKYEEKDTLHIGDSIEKIDKRIALLKNLYPKAKYINNHTGSMYTADYESMDKLMKVLKKYDFHFVDSRTTAKSVAVDTAKKNGVKVLSRNIFLDNKLEYAYIEGQLKKALKIAKRDGFAIAIGHPHKMTIKVLMGSKELLKDFEVVTIDKLPL